MKFLSLDNNFSKSFFHSISFFEQKESKKILDIMNPNKDLIEKNPTKTAFELNF